MATDLESLRTEVDGFLAQTSLTAFHGYPSQSDLGAVYWDNRRKPDFRMFLQTAEKIGQRLIVISQEQFLLDEIDEVREQLEESNLDREEKRNFEHRIQDLQKYEGFTARLELSFTWDSRIYIFRVEADWYRAWDDIVLEVEAATVPENGEGEDGSMSGYFSAN